MTEIILCEKCGEEAHFNDTYCAYCGANLKIQKNAWKAINEPNNTTNLILDGQFLEAYYDLTAKLKNLENIDLGFDQHQQYFKQLSIELQASQEKLNTFHNFTEKELKDVEDLKKITWKSIKAGVKGNKDDLLKKEEAEYLNALNREESLKQDILELQKRYSIAKTEIEHLSRLKKQKYDYNIQLIRLIDQVCEGVPDPIEDKIEADLLQLKNQLQPISAERINLKNALGHISNAQQHFQFTLNKLGSAKGLSDWDTFFGGGFLADSMKHSRMSEARNGVQQAQRSLNRAYQLVPSLPKIRGAQVEEMNMFWDTFFDNIFSDLNAREKIIRSRHSVEQAFYETQQASQWLNSRIVEKQQIFQGINSKIQSKRQDLIRERKRMIENALKQQ
ncbi:hypothetical protein [Candidatus Lokiarchaeum ossiferum]|uniref:hypothetical protein n=1 Tax=Candidatus Lokiarchaeum ossiferum TaxID=2951803 RepID=UPI00352ECE2A